MPKHRRLWYLPSSYLLTFQKRAVTCQTPLVNPDDLKHRLKHPIRPFHYYWVARVQIWPSQGCFLTPILGFILFVALLAVGSSFIGEMNWKRHERELWRDGGFSVQADLREFAGVRHFWQRRGVKQDIAMSMIGRSLPGVLRQRTRHYGILPANLTSTVDSKFPWQTIPYRKPKTYDYDGITADCQTITSWFYSEQGKVPVERAVYRSPDGKVEGEIVRAKGSDNGYCFDMTRPR